MKSPKSIALPSIVLAGLESAGKTALFRGLTGHAIADEANYRGSTVVCRRCRLTDCACEVVDTPGIRISDDASTTRAALQQVVSADVVLLVARGTHVVSEVETLLRELDVRGKRSALAITFADRAPQAVHELAALYRQRLSIPVHVLDARSLAQLKRDELLADLMSAPVLQQTDPGHLPIMSTVSPQRTWLERPWLGPWLAFAIVLGMFALPVFAAYHLAAVLQPWLDIALESLKATAATWPILLQTVLTGSYGVLTLGAYSFLWAFPVVLFIALSTALIEEIGLKDRITAALDPALRHVGLSGRDLLPVLTGFGCNVVAVLHSRSCSSCTRQRCASMISLGSACSYQIGATLSLFSAAGSPQLFLPYLAALFIIGALHVRLWHGRLEHSALQPMHERSFLQWPSLRSVRWRMLSTLRQFLLQAMPIFLLMCAVAALMHDWGWLAAVAKFATPLLTTLHLPAESATALALSLLRKDGLLALQGSSPSLLTLLSSGQLFAIVWLGSTLSSCIVTLAAIRRELGWRAVPSIIIPQAITALLTTALLRWIWP
jgi:ferrous iron transport protein B